MLGKKAILLGICAVIALAVVRRSVKAWTSETAEAQTIDPTVHVEAINPVSIHLVDEAIANLSQGWPALSEEEREAFQLIYDPAATGEIDEQFARTVLGNYKEIRQTLENEIEVVYAADSDLCDGQRLYFTDLFRIYVCPYFFEEENELRKARTLIHEMTHIALLVTDRPYYRPTSQKYAELTPTGSPAAQLPLVGPVLREVLRGDTLYHPDAYAHYALKSAGYSDINEWESETRSQALQKCLAPERIERHAILIKGFRFRSICCSVPLNNAFPPGINGGLSPVGKVQFTQDIAHMPLDRMLSNYQLPGNFTVTQTISD